MDEVRVGVDEDFFVHGQAVNVDHPVVDPLLRREGHAGQGLPDVEHPGVDLILAAFQLGEVQHVLDQPGQPPGLLTDQLQIVVLHLRRDGPVQNAIDEALDGGHGGAQLVGDVAHELAPGVVVHLDVFGHGVKGAGQVGHFALALDALHTDREVAAAKPLGSIRHFLERVGKLVHQHFGQHAGAEQHHAGRQQEVGPELLLELRQLLTGGAEEDITAVSAPLRAQLTGRDIALLREHTVHGTEEVVVFRCRVGLLQHRFRHSAAAELVRVGGDEHVALVVRKEQVGLRALANDLQLGAQGVQLLALGQSRLLHQILRCPPGDIDHLIQRGVAVLGKIIAEQQPL